MDLGKARSSKLTLSCSHRRLRLAVAHHGAPSTWTAPAKEPPPAPARPGKGKRR
jgi:hypothetical protein